MTAEPSAAAIKAARDRARRAASTPVDVQAMLVQGRQMKAQIAARARDETALLKVETAALVRLKTIKRTVSPQVRARMLGELADWLVKQQSALLDRLICAEPLPKLDRSTRVPPWVPDEMVGVWRREWKAHGEIAAAHVIRKLKRERAA